MRQTGSNRGLVALGVALALAASTGCGDDGSAAAGTGSGGGGTGSTTSSGSGGALPVAHVRIANVVPGSVFDGFDQGADFGPQPSGQDLTYGEVSDYFDVTLNPVTNIPLLVILPDGETPDANDPNWLNVTSPAADRARIDMSGVEAEQYVTLIVSLTDQGTNISVETLYESMLAPGTAGKAHLHVAWRLFDLGGTFVPTLAVVGQPCLTTDSVAVNDVLSVDPGAFELGIYDRQNVSECTELLGSTPLDVAADTDELVVVYHEADTIDFMSAPIPPH
ncbi:MAG TPA: hypothetical protein VL400_20755 [Polyangiaceae bacterium]|nr:hypothetical protein [Polyangiaceae bacterium]